MRRTLTGKWPIALTLPLNLVRFFQDEDLQRTVEESEKLYSNYAHYFDKIIVNENLDDALKELKQCIEALSTEPQWVPVSWVY